MTHSIENEYKGALRTLLLIKPFSALIGLATIALLPVIFSQAIYADYLVLWAAYELTILLSNLGTFHATYRYLSRRHEPTNQTEPLVINGPARTLTVLRLVLLIASAVLFGTLLSNKHITLSSASPEAISWIVALVAFVIISEGMCRYFENVADALVLQRPAQLSALIRAFARVSGFLLLSIQDDVSLLMVCAVDFVSALVSLAFLCATVGQVIYKSKDQRLSRTCVKAAVAFAVPSYIAQAIGVSYSPDVVKLYLSSSTDTASMAVFGLAFSIVAMPMRYLPSAILSGVLRPAFVSAEIRGISPLGPNRSLAALVGITLKMNTIFLVFVLTALFILAYLMSARARTGQYAELPNTLIMTSAFLIPVAVHQSLGLLFLAKEVSKPTMAGTVAALIATAATLTSTHELKQTGAALSIFIGELIWCITAIAFSNNILASYPRKPLIISLIPLLIVSFSALALQLQEHANWLPAIAQISLVLCLIIAAMNKQFFTEDEQAVLRHILPTKLTNLMVRLKQLQD